MKKIKSFIDSLDFHTVVRVICICFCLILLFSSCLTVFAYDSSIFPYTFTISNPLNVPHSSVNVSLFNQTWHTEQDVLGTQLTATRPIGSDFADMIVTVTDNEVSITGFGVIPNFENDGVPVGTYNVLFYADVVSDYITLVFPRGTLPSGSLIGANDDTLIGMYVYNASDFINPGQYQLFSNDNPISDSITQITMVLLPTNDEPPVDECPSLQVQINQYQGTWNDFECMLLGSTNEVIYQGYRNKLQELFRQGQDSVTLEQLIADYDGSFQDLVTLLSENNLRLLDEYSQYINEQRTQSYNDGYAQGNEDGFNDGYNRGYNRGTSEVFGENLLGETFNMPLNALNNWVLFETSTGIEVTMGGLFTAVIALAVLVIFLKMFAGG